jgi:putative sterol carrier protein
MSSQVKELIESLPDAFLPEKAGDAQATIQLDLTGEGGGQWVLSVADRQLKVWQEAASQADVRVTMNGDDFAALYRNELDPVRAFMGGKIKVSGNVGLVMQLLTWFDRGS